MFINDCVKKNLFQNAKKYFFTFAVSNENALFETNFILKKKTRSKFLTLLKILHTKQIFEQ